MDKREQKMRKKAAVFEARWRTASKKYNQFLKEHGTENTRRNDRLYKDMEEQKKKYVDAAYKIHRGGTRRRHPKHRHTRRR
jgi:hypothetical protein